MLFRAIFWIGLVSLLMPHEPDLGFGRPGTQTAGIAAPSGIGALIQTATGMQGAGAEGACAAHAKACAGGLSILDGFQSVAVRSMDEVRADLEAHRTKLHGI
jgi:hypothetical protein